MVDKISIIVNNKIESGNKFINRRRGVYRQILYSQYRDPVVYGFRRRINCNDPS